MHRAKLTQCLYWIIIVAWIGTTTLQYTNAASLFAKLVIQSDHHSAENRTIKAGTTADVALHSIENADISPFSKNAFTDNVVDSVFNDSPSAIIENIVEATTAKSKQISSAPELSHTKVSIPENDIKDARFIFNRIKEKTKKSRDITIGPCVWAVDRKCPDSDIKFFLYTRRNPMLAQYIHISDTRAKSNLTASHFNPRYPSKIIIHGYNADMFMHTLHQMRLEYLAKDEYNIFYVDWSILAVGPCYMSAAHNIKHVGLCTAGLVDAISLESEWDIHVIGFSLGAQVTNYIARNSTYTLDRITGLDPAMPLFVTASINDKLDPSDAKYVDVIHTNALVQGKIERCGHSDFYMNGGIMQPGCSAPGVQPFACSHQRAAEYFLESIRSRKGFFGWPCSSYISYLLGLCPPTNYLVEAGEPVRTTTKGMFIVETNDTSPYALGKWTDLPTLGFRRSTPTTITLPPANDFRDPLLQKVDHWNKLESNFNNLQDYALGDDTDLWSNFYRSNSKFIPHNNDDLGNSKPFWRQYKRNLTAGVIEDSLFKVPMIAEHETEQT